MATTSIAAARSASDGTLAPARAAVKLNAARTPRAKPGRSTGTRNRIAPHSATRLHRISQNSASKKANKDTRQPGSATHGTAASRAQPTSAGQCSQRRRLHARPASAAIATAPSDGARSPRARYGSSLLVTTTRSWTTQPSTVISAARIRASRGSSEIGTRAVASMTRSFSRPPRYLACPARRPLLRRAWRTTASTSRWSSPQAARYSS